MLRNHRHQILSEGTENIALNPCSKAFPDLSDASLPKQLMQALNGANKYRFHTK